MKTLLLVAVLSLLCPCLSFSQTDQSGQEMKFKIVVEYGDRLSVFEVFTSHFEFKNNAGSTRKVEGVKASIDRYFSRIQKLKAPDNNLDLCPRKTVILSIAKSQRAACLGEKNPLAKELTEIVNELSTMVRLTPGK